MQNVFVGVFTILFVDKVVKLIWESIPKKSLITGLLLEKAVRRNRRMD